MSRRYWIVLVCLILAVLGPELAVRFVQSARSRVRITNSAQTAIEDLVVTYAGSRVSLGDLSPGETIHAHLSAGPKGILDLAFKQSGNPMSGFQITDYDPRALRRDDLEQVLEIKENQVTRYLDDAGASTPMGRLWQKIRDWVAGEFDSARLHLP